MNKNIHNISFIFFILFLSLIFMNTYWAFFRENFLCNLPQNLRNKENLALRGGILSSSGEYLAKTINKNGKPVRIYPQGELCAPLVGYLDESLGKAGLEYSCDRELKSQPFPLTIDGFKERWQEGMPKGYNIYLTLNLSLCRKAFDLLGDRNGAVVAINPVTGELLAMISKPAYDPEKVNKDWDYYVKSKDAPLLDRVSQGLYTPGSIFKILVLSAALEEGTVNENTTFDCPGFIDIDGHTFNCGHAHGKQDYKKALANSCNVAFSLMGMELGNERLLKYFNKFFCEDFNFPLPLVKANLDEKNLLTPTYLAQTSFGQGELLLSPMEAVLMTSTMANKGKMPCPLLIKEIRDSKSRLIKKFNPSVLNDVISSDTAAKVSSAMEAVVLEGTGYSSYINGIAVAGKTGTAEQPNGPPHAWFVGFAPVENPTIAVAVIVEGGGHGGEIAAPIAREIILEGMR